MGILVVAAIVAATASLSAASTARRKQTPVSPDAVLIWNTNTVNAVRASTPTKFQTDGMVYMSYVQAAVYDAVTKISGRYEPYHDFTVAVAPGASVQAAVAAAARTTLDYYLPDQQPAVDAEYNAYLATLSGNVSGGVAVGEAAAQDIIAFRTGDGLKAATPELWRDRADSARTVAAAAESVGADALARDDASVPARARPRSSARRRRLPSRATSTRRT